MMWKRQKYMHCTMGQRYCGLVQPNPTNFGLGRVRVSGLKTGLDRVGLVLRVKQLGQESRVHLTAILWSYILIFMQILNHKIAISVFPHIVSSFEYVPQQKFSLLSQKLKYCSNYLNCLHFPNSKKNSFRGNQLYEKIRYIFLFCSRNIIETLHAWYGLTQEDCREKARRA